MSFLEKTSCGIEYMTASNISAVNAFTTRAGGVSDGIYFSLNLGENTGDSRENIMENYLRLCSALEISPARLVFPRQVHRDTVLQVSGSDCHSLFEPVPYEADGLITNEKNLALIVFTADCIPVLLYDPVSSSIGAVHCGWRGTVMGIAGRAVSQMATIFGARPENIRAAIGPGISKCCFETGADVPKGVFDILGSESDAFISPKGEKFMVDLKGINRRILERAGLAPKNIEISDECTMCSHEKYWSHRYTGGKRGSQASVIMLKG